MTTRRNLSIPLGLSSTESLEVARHALAQLGWPLMEDEPRRLVATEDPTRLHCHCQPIEVELTLSEPRDDGVDLLVETRVPGRGPISANHAQTQTAVLVRRILAASSPER